MTKLEFVNRVFFQWIFVRLTKSYDEYFGNDKPRGKYGWCFMYWVHPKTGWSDDYIFIGNKGMRLTRRFFERIQS